MFDPNANASPINRIPPVILAIFLLVTGLEILFQLTQRDMIGRPELLGLRVDLIQKYGFVDTLFEYMRVNHVYDWETLHRFVTFPFMHFSGQHAIMAGLMFLAIGKGVADYFHPLSVVALFVIVNFVGALAVGLLGSHNQYLVGLFTAVYGFLGAVVWMMIYRPGTLKRGSKTALQLVGFLVVMQIVFHFAIRGDDEWINRFAGLGTGFLLSYVLGPDGLQRVRGFIDQMRQR